MTDNRQNEKQDRRDFFRTLGRRIAYVFLGFGGMILFARSEKKGRDEHRCTGDGVCPGCTRFGDCILPQAVSARKKGRR